MDDCDFEELDDSSTWFFGSCPETDRQEALWGVGKGPDDLEQHSFPEETMIAVASTWRPQPAIASLFSMPLREIVGQHTYPPKLLQLVWTLRSRHRKGPLPSVRGVLK